MMLFGSVNLTEESFNMSEKKTFIKPNQISKPYYFLT